MSSVHLESWVKQQYKEIGFGHGGNGPFIGKAALKQRLICRYPIHKTRIRQLVNAIKHHDLPATQSHTRKISQAPAEPQPKKSSPILKSKAVPLSSQTSDSGFASGPEKGAQKIIKDESSAVKKTPVLDFQVQSPVSEVGGAELEGLRWNTCEYGEKGPSEKLKTADLTPANQKISQLKNFLVHMQDSISMKYDDTENAASTLDLQIALLNIPSTADKSGDRALLDDVENAVLFSADVLENADKDSLPQFGLLGSSGSTSSTTISNSRLFLNTNIPFSAFVCGVQGSGKSHTTACMIENYLIPAPVLGVLQKPLSTLVFNFAEYASSSSFRPCELAFLASPGSHLPSNSGVKKVNVLVSPSNHLSMKALYTQLPGVTVQPFLLRPKDLNISMMLTLMSVNQTEAAPLYMGTVTKILRKMASETIQAFDYPEFRRRLDDAGFDKKQEEFLNQRLDLLESFLDLDGSTSSPEFAAGEITIMDLSCPFMDASTACVLFKIGMGLYLESDSTIGKVIVLDEAHKFMTDTPASKALTDSLMGVIRQQRHYGARVIISTQEPTISPKLIDLCSITIMHRFSSPEWLDVLQKHILVSDEEGSRVSKVGLLREIMRLRTGEAMVFAPSAIFGTRNETERRILGADELLKIRMRKRVTWDGGKSIVCI